MPEIFAQIKLDYDAIQKDLGEVEKLAAKAFTNEKGSAQVKELTNQIKHQLDVTQQINNAEKEFATIQDKVMQGQIKYADAVKKHSESAEKLAVQKEKLVKQMEAEGKENADLVKQIDLIEKAYQDNIKAVAAYSDKQNKVKNDIAGLRKELTPLQRDLGAVVEAVKDVGQEFNDFTKSIDNLGEAQAQQEAKWNNAIRLISETTEKMKAGDAEFSTYEDRMKGAAQAMLELEKAGKKSGEEYKKLKGIYNEASKSAYEFKTLEEKVATAAEGGSAKFDAMSNVMGQMATTGAALGGTFGNLSSVLGNSVASVGGLKAQFFEIDKTMSGSQATMAKAAAGFAVVGAAAMQAFQVIDGLIRANEQATIDAGKTASTTNLDIESFNIGNKSLTDRIDLVNKLAETNPKMAASLRGAIGSEKEFEEATRKAQQELKALRQEGVAMEWKTEQTGGGLLGWLKAAGNSIEQTAKNMGQFLVAMEDFRTGTATAMAKGSEAVKGFQSTTDGWKNRIIQMDIQIAEKQGDINKSHELQLNLIRAEGKSLQDNLNLTIMTLRAQEKQNIVSGGESSVALGKQFSTLTGVASKAGKYAGDIMAFVQTAIRETNVAVDDIFKKGATESSKAWEAIWEKIDKNAKDKLDNRLRTFLQSSGGELEVAVKAYVEMARGTKEVTEGNKGLAAIIKELEKSYQAIPGYTQEIIDRQKILWNLEKDGAKTDKERLDTKKETVKVISQLVDNEKEYQQAMKEIADADKEAQDRRTAALKKQQEYRNSEKSILDIIAGKQAELDKLNGVGSTNPQAQIEAIGKAAGMSKEAIQGLIDKYNEIANAIDEVTKKINEAKQAEKEYNEEVNGTKNLVDNIVKSWEKQAEDDRIKRMGEQMAENLLAPLKDIKIIEGVTDGLVDNLNKQITQAAQDAAKKIDSLNKEFSKNQNAMKTADSAQIETLKKRNEEIRKEIQETLQIEKDKRSEIVKEYSKGLEKALKTESEKLDKMLADYDKRILDREKQTQDAKLKLNDYVYRQTHTAEENAVRDAVSNFQKEYEEFRKAGVEKVDLVQWQTLKQKELTKDFTAQQLAAFEAQKKAAIESSEAIVKAAQEAWDKETKKQRDEINTQIDLVNQLRQAALDAKNILLELLGQPVDNRQAAVTPKLGETPPSSGQTTQGKEPPLSYGAGLGVGGNVTWNGIVWKWTGKGWDFVKYVEKIEPGAPILGGIGGGRITPGDIPRGGNNLLEGVVDNAIGLTKDGAIQTAIGNAFGHLGLGQIAGKSFVDTFKEILVGKEGSGGLAGEVPGYGKTIVEMLAKGISDNAHLLREAVDKLTLEISLQLEPHSPPKEGRLHTIDKWMPKIVGLLTKGVLTDSDVRKPFYILADKIASSLGVGLDYGVIQAARQFKSSYSKNMAPLIASVGTPSVYGSTWQGNPASDENPAYALWEKQKKQLLEFQAFEAALSMRPGSGLNWTEYESGGKYENTEMAKIFSKNREFDIQNGTDGKIGLGTNMAKGLLESSWFKALTPQITDRQILEKYGQFGKQNMPNYNAFAGYNMEELYTLLPYLKASSDDDTFYKLLNRVYFNLKEMPNEAGIGGISMNDRFNNFQKYQGINIQDYLTADFANQYQVNDPRAAEMQYLDWQKGQASIDAMKASGAWGTPQNRPAAIDSGYAQGYDEWAKTVSWNGGWDATNFESYESYARRMKTFPGDSALMKLTKDRAGYIDQATILPGNQATNEGGGYAGNIYYVSININGDNLNSEQVANLVIEKMGATGDIYA